jgi:hypothetical protein
MIWMGLRTLGIVRMFNEDYQWAFTPRSLQTQLERAGFIVQEIVFLCEVCSDYSTCKEPNEYLVIAQRM